MKELISFGIFMNIDIKHIFLTSDHHFGSYRLPSIFRVFSKDEEDIAIDKWNSVVGKTDTVIYVGDFSDCNLTDLIEYRKRLTGNIVLIKGNHDMFPDNVYEAVFQDVKTKLIIPELNLDIAHIPREKISNHICIYGHLHRGSTFKPLLPNHKFCTCASRNNGYPVRLDSILSKVSKI